MAEEKASVEITGEIVWIEMGSGTWGLKSDDQTYELYGDEAEPLDKEGQKIKVIGKIRDDVMTMAMAGPVLEVESFEAVG